MSSHSMIFLRSPAFGLAQGTFGGVEVVPAFPDGQLNALGVEVLQDGLVAAERGGRVAFVVGNDVRLMKAEPRVACCLPVRKEEGESLGCVRIQVERNAGAVGAFDVDFQIGVQRLEVFLQRFHPG